MIKIESIFQLTLLILFVFLFLYLLTPFVFILLLALAVVITSYPLYTKILQLVVKPSISALIMLFIITIVVLFPTYFIGLLLYEQTVTIYEQKDILLESTLLENCSHTVCDVVYEHITTLINSLNVLLNNFALQINDNIGTILNSLSQFLVQIFMFYVSLFYFFINKDSFISNIKKITPLKVHTKEILLLKLKKVCRAVFINNLLIASIQGVLVGVGLYFFGIAGSALWGLIAAFLALIPFIGASIIWFPVALFLLLSGELLAGLSLLIYGSLIIAGSDTLLRPLLLEKSIHVHPFLILLSIMGGIQVFGFVGIFYGPIIISVLVALLEVYDFTF